VVPLRERQRAQTKELIIKALVDALVDGDLERATHDALAKAVGVSRMTVYRYFPDRDALLQAMWKHGTAQAGPRVKFPENEAELLSTLRDVYEGFDQIAPLATLIRSTPQGRAVRLSEKKRRQDTYRTACADLVKDLPEADQRLATAVLQFLHTSAWLEMRDHWDMTGAEMAKACAWALRTLMRDLRTRNGRALGEADEV
jgi:AcrR family transcriptional regulator